MDTTQDVPQNADEQKNPFEGLTLDAIASAYKERLKALGDEDAEGYAKLKEAEKAYQEIEKRVYDSRRKLEAAKNAAVAEQLKKLGDLRGILQAMGYVQPQAAPRTSRVDGKAIREWLITQGITSAAKGVSAGVIKRQFNLADNVELGKALRYVGGIATNGQTRFACRYFAVANDPIDFEDPFELDEPLGKTEENATPPGNEGESVQTL